MKKLIAKKWSNEDGVVMLIVLMILMAVSLLGMASLLVVGTDIRISGHYKRSAQAFWAAEAGVQRGLAALNEDREYAGDIAQETLNNSATSSADIAQMSTFLKRVVATGRSGGAIRKVEVIVNVDSVFEAAINAGGDVILDGKPRISTEGVRINGDAYLNLDAGTPELNIYMSEGSTLNAEGHTTNLHRFDKEPMDLSAIKLTDEQWMEMAASAHGDYKFNDDGVFGNGDTNVSFTDLDFDDIEVGPDGHRAIYVDGDVHVSGELSGIGTIIATGKIICEGEFETSNKPTVSMIAKDDVLLNFDTESMSELNGLVYTEGDYELHGKIKFWGVVTAFGSVTIQNPSEFTNNSCPNYWYTYSPAYNIIADPIDVLSWTEITSSS